MPTVDTDILAEIVRRIVDGWHPERIILFGSRARGDARPDSDYDLLVIMPEGQDSHAVAGKMYRAMIGVHAGVDIILSTAEEHDWRRGVIGNVDYDVAREGVVVHERRRDAA